MLDKSQLDRVELLHKLEGRLPDVVGLSLSASVCKCEKEASGKVPVKFAEIIELDKFSALSANPKTCELTT